MDRDHSPGSTIVVSEMGDRYLESSPVRPPQIAHLQQDGHMQPPSTTITSERGDLSDEESAMARDSIEAQSQPTSLTQSSKSKTRSKPRLSDAQDDKAETKVKHLKKDDGLPLWRRDIQYDFLKTIFEDARRVFTNSYEPEREKQSFADLYIDAMARSSKTSKILRDKLLSEHEPAKNMAMVCLLVNLGRMNTTLNCKKQSLLYDICFVHTDAAGSFS